MFLSFCAAAGGGGGFFLQMRLLLVIMLLVTGFGVALCADLPGSAVENINVAGRQFYKTGCHRVGNRTISVSNFFFSLSLSLSLLLYLFKIEYCIVGFY